MKKNNKKTANKLLLILLILHFALTVTGATYYVSNAGNDLNSGLSSFSAWKTLDKVQTVNLIAGDQILLERGSIFYGSITVKSSGTALSPITFGNYGTGANPIITGFTNVTAWTNLSSNIWESTNAVSTLSTCNVVSINGVLTPMGRTPNSNAVNKGYLTYTSSTSTSLTSASLTGTPNWTGAEVLIRTSNFTMDRRVITSQSASTINWTTATGRTPDNGFGFFIQNDARTLDAQNEWYYDTSTKKIRIYSTSQPTNVKVSSIDKLINVTKNYITIDGIDLVGANTYGIWNDATDTPIKTYLTVQNCNISFVGTYGILLRATNVLYENNTLSNSNGGGIGTSSTSGYVTIRGNTINNIGIHPGQGSVHGSLGSGNYTSNVLIEKNKITNVGFNGITFHGNNITVKNNFIDTFCQIMDDGGGIYTYTGSEDVLNNVVLDGNIIINGVGAPEGTDLVFPAIAAGIYCDNKSKNIEIKNNSISNCRKYGLFFNDASYIHAHDNTIFGTWETVANAYSSQFKINHTWSPTTFYSNFTISNNIFFSKSANQFCFDISSPVNNILNFGIANNNMYARPINESKTIRADQPTEWSGSKELKTLVEWQSFSGDDANSKKSLQLITSEGELQFEYNETETAKLIALSIPMIDTKGIKYSSRITLQPFTSVVLMKDANPAKNSTEYKSICDGYSYNGWTTTGKYERILTAKSGADSIVTTYLTVNPKYAVKEDITITSGEIYQGWISSGTYTRSLTSVSGCDSVITTNLIVESNTIKVGEMTQTIELKKGNNMISTFLNATNPDVSIVTQTIRDSGNLIKMQNESGSSYENWGILGGWINNLGSIQNTEGYKIMVANNCTIQITGKQVALPLGIPLNVGWNIISFPRADILDAKMIIQSLIDQNVLVKVQDEIGNSIEDWGSFGGWKNGIGNFQPGKAYRVKVSTNTTLTIKDSYPKSVVALVYAEQTQHYFSLAEGNGSDHMNINLVGLNESSLTTGDEIAAFDGDLCLGALQITDQHLLEGSASLIASYSTNNLIKDGFKEGSSIQLHVWNHLNGEESGIQFSVLKGSSKYLKYESAIVKLKSLMTTVNNKQNQTLIEVYPNPSHGRFTVRFSDMPAAGSRIDVFDLAGRKVASRQIAGTSEEINLSGQAAGMYLVKTLVGAEESLHKLVIQ